MDRRITIQTIAGMLEQLTDEELSETFWRVEEIVRNKRPRRRRSFIGIHKLASGPPHTK